VDNLILHSTELGNNVTVLLLLTFKGALN